MRTGTFICWLWGHKFIGINSFEIINGEQYQRYKLFNHCQRCGKLNEDLLTQKP